MFDSQTIDFEIILPDKTSCAFGYSKPKAQLVVGDGDTYKISLALGKYIKTHPSEFESNTTDILFKQIEDKSYDFAWKKVLSLLKRRDYTRQEIRFKLKQDGFSKNTINKVLRAAVDINLVNDERFAQSFIYSKKALGWGKNRIARELSNKGIDTDDIVGWPEAFFDYESEYMRAYEILSRKAIPAKNPYQKLVRFLVNRGFSYQIAKSCTQKVLENEDYDVSYYNN